MNDSFNPYHAPNSSVEQSPDWVAGEPGYFTVGQGKLLAMSLCTMGIYHIYWFYKNWTMIASRSSTKMMPAARSIFSLFYCHACFKDIEKAAKAQEIPTSFDASVAAVAFIIAALCGRAPGAFGLIGFLVIIPVMMANALAIKVNASVAPELNGNTRIEGWNWVAIIGGSVLFILAVAGLILK